MAAIKIIVERKDPSIGEKTGVGAGLSRERRHIGLSGKVGLIAVSVTLIALAVGAIVFLNRPSATPHSSASQKILAQVKDFTPYFFPNGNSADGFQLASTNGIVYSDGILFITLTNATEQTITITEQALPDTLAHSTDVIGDEPVTGVDGKAAIAYRDGRTNGSMISRDHRTLITLTCSNTVASSAVMDIMRVLFPTTGH